MISKICEFEFNIPTGRMSVAEVKPEPDLAVATVSGQETAACSRHTTLFSSVFGVDRQFPSFLLQQDAEHSRTPDFQNKMYSSVSLTVHDTNQSPVSTCRTVLFRVYSNYSCMR